MQVTRSRPVENFEPHQLQTAAALEHLQVDFATGLSTTEVKRRHSEYGPNELTGTSTRSLWRILWDQLTATMVVVLLAAAAISLAMRDFKSAIAILAIVIFNAVLGFVQEYRAERAIAALKKLASPNPKVRRDGWLQQVPMQDLVPGDIVSFEAGDLVPADCRLLQAETLRIEEAALTGEAEPVAKDAGRVLDERTPLSERCNMAYLGTTVCQGHAVAVVVRTAMQTELGRIAGMLQTVE